MKTLGRILLILAAFTSAMGITYLAVNRGSSSASTNGPAFERGNGRNFQPGGEQPQFFNGQRPEFDSGRRSGFGGAGASLGWILGMLKNVGIIAVIILLIVVPKGIWRKRIRTISASTG